MSKVVVFGNSGAGKSTLARRMSGDTGAAHLELDTLAWKATTPPQRKPLSVSHAEITVFIQTHSDWVIEGCYADLIALTLPFADKLIFLDLPVDACIAHARARPWEPHKYTSKEAQDANLSMLMEWITDYPRRSDSCSRPAHIDLFDAFAGSKTRISEPLHSTPTASSAPR